MIDPNDFFDGNAFETLLDVLTGGMMSEPLLATFAAVGIIVPLWLISDDLALPTVITILFGGIAAAVLPGDYQQVAVFIMAIGIATATFEIGRRYFL